MSVLLVDLSHYNAEPDWAALKAGGVVGVILKASEGTGYADPVFSAWRAAAHAAGLAVGMYGFADLGTAAAEATWFARVVGGLQPGEFVGLDEEVTRAGVDPVAWAGQWIDALAAAGIPVRLLYINKSFLAGHDWSPIVARGVLLWLADYDRTPALNGAPSGPWPALTLKQFTDAGTVPGEPGTVDVDVLFGTLDQLTGPLGGLTMATLTDAQAQQLLSDSETTRVLLQWAVDTTLGKGPAFSTAGELTQAIRDTHAQVASVAGAVQALAAQVAALQSAVAAAPGMTCQGNPQAVLTAIGQKFSAPATPA